MIYRKLNNNDYSLGGGSSDFLSGVEAVAQAIITRINLLKNEWWENLNDGTPLWQQVLGASGKEIKVIDKIFIDRIKGTQGVSSIESYESTFDTNTRKYSFVATVNTQYGTTTVEDTL